MFQPAQRLSVAYCVVAASLILVSATHATDDYYDIGNIHYPVTTDSPQAQTWCDRGIAMCFGFNHEEAVKCFEKAIQADSGCVMAHWGIAYALGPNMNNMEIIADQMARAYQSIHLANLLKGTSTPVETDLVEALAKRYAATVPEDREPLNVAYSIAMQEVAARHPDNSLVVCLYAESLMNLQPWAHWNREGVAAEHTTEIVKVLEDGLQKWPDSPALCHLYIHMMEMSPIPEKALPAADRLFDAVGGSGHLIHMPSHIYLRVGDYDEVINANEAAIAVDEEYVQDAGPYNFYSLYRIHNYHFLVYGAMFDGQSEVALQTAREINKQVPEDVLKEQVDYLDAFMPTALHVMIRFGKWDDILDEPEPAEYLPMSRAIRLYARGIAYAATGRVAEAQQEQTAFQLAVQQVPETCYLFQNMSLDILGVADAMLDGEIAYREGDYDRAFRRLEDAVRLDDGLKYDEPWGWMQPARHALGALLLEQGQAVRAEGVFRQDLKLHPHNMWALHGLAESLRRQEKTEEAEAVALEFKVASARADIQVDRSCFCRLETDCGKCCDKK